jgi:N6-L-threonylcarbamoyladenine synthase
MLTLGIESTCDETAAAVLKDGKEILSNIIYSQADLHQKYGGVYPEIASRCHLKKIIPVIDEALKEAKIDFTQIDHIAVASGPGLIGSLLIGLNCAKALSYAWNVPYIGVNHIEAHLYSAMLEGETLFPSLGVVISGGHTQILYMPSFGEYTLLGTTIDDAIGESFDKVACLLGLGYPGGPRIEKLAKEGDPNKYLFRAGQIENRPLDFSFSGLKTNVMYKIKGPLGKKDSPDAISLDDKKHIAASFQKTALEDLIHKVFLAAKQNPIKAIYFGGGVSNNKTLREMFDQYNKNFSYPLFWPSFGLSLDNAVMIAALGYQKFLKKKQGDPLSLEAKTRFSLA